MACASNSCCFLISAGAAAETKAILQLLLRYGGGSFFDQLGRFLWMRDVGRVARTHLGCLGVGALGHLALVFRIDRPVLRRHLIPAGFRLPSRRSNWRCE